MWYYSGSFGFTLLQAPAPMAGGSGFLLGALLLIIAGIFLGFVLGVRFSRRARKPKSKAERSELAQQPLINTPQPFQAPARRAASHARRCPVCNSTYTDEALIYCVSDGTPLVPVINNSSTHDSGATLLYREAGNRDVPPTVPSRPDENRR
jgi:hypothetical protein